MRQRPAVRAAATLAASILAASSATAQEGLVLELVVDGLDAPTLATAPDGEPSKLFVLEQEGLVKIVENGQVLPTPFLDLTGIAHVSGLSGLTSLRFHPDYFQNGWVYVLYARIAGNSAEVVLERYVVPDPPSYVIDPGQTSLLFGPVTDVISFHSGTGMDFGPDGKLYFALGDRRIEIPGDGCTALDGGRYIGKLLRLEDDGSVPADNPFVGDPGVLDEIWAVGLRQPYRLAFDTTGDLYVADVGESAREEVSVLPVGMAPGQNFGWKVHEGTSCFGFGECSALPCPSPGSLPPIHEYDHAEGCSIVGGFVVRGSDVPSLEGKYLFADFCQPRVWSLRYVPGTGATELVEESLAMTLPAGHALDQITSFGRDGAGRPYLVDGGAPGLPDGTGAVYRIRSVDALVASPGAISASAGGSQAFALDAPASLAGQAYLLLGSASGTEPGLPIDSVVLPLAPLDPWFAFTLGSPNSPALPGSFGFLDGSGDASASLVIPAGAPASLVGLTFHHAYLVIDLAVVQAVFVSNPTAVDFTG